MLGINPCGPVKLMIMQMGVDMLTFLGGREVFSIRHLTFGV